MCAIENTWFAEDLPVFALQDDRVVEIVGEPTAVHRGIELIGSHLRKFLVDRSIIPVFEMQVSFFTGLLSQRFKSYCITKWA